MAGSNPSPPPVLLLLLVCVLNGDGDKEATDEGPIDLASLSATI